MWICSLHQYFWMFTMHETLSTPSFGTKPLYSGFDCDRWGARDIDIHKHKAMEHKAASTNEKQKQILQTCGIKYSEMILIPNFNIMCCHVIDPMHYISFHYCLSYIVQHFNFFITVTQGLVCINNLPSSSCSYGTPAPQLVESCLHC